MYYDSPREESQPRPRLTPHEHAALLAVVLMLLVFALSSFVLPEISFNGNELQTGVTSERTLHATHTSLPAEGGNDAYLQVPPLLVAIALLFLLVLGSMAALLIAASAQFCYACLRRVTPV